jgi:low affinity Fe/Cu permease
MKELFRKFSSRTSEIVGSSWAFIAAVIVIVVWAVTGPVFHYSDTWQLIINTGTTIVTFLMVFLIQNTQNRDSKAIHLKLDELIRSMQGARNGMVDLEDLSDDELKRLQAEFQRMREREGKLPVEPEEITEELDERREDAKKRQPAPRA